jgi:hypothetical protein
MVVSGDATAMTYDFTANKLSIELQEMRDATAVLAAEALMNFNTVSGLTPAPTAISTWWPMTWRSAGWISCST